MAVDTRDKRSSASRVGLPWRKEFPTPDGQGANTDMQRAHLAWAYGGIPLAPVIPGEDNIRIGDADVEAVALGDTVITAVYVGDFRAWP